MPDAVAFRAEFPVLERLAYLNAGTDGPIARRAAAAAAARARAEMEHGRSGAAHMDSLMALWAELRAAVAELLNCAPAELALTHSTTDGINIVLHSLELPRGSEVVTSDEEHPGVVAPLALAAQRRGLRIRAVPFGGVGAAVGPHTRLVVCSHVSWVSGRLVDLAPLAGRDVLVLLDGAQGLGAVPVDVKALGCDYYAASGQKWLCGPDGSGYLYVRAERLAVLRPPWPNYMSLSDPPRAAELALHADARRFDLGAMSGPQSAWARAALAVLHDAGWSWVLDRGPTLAARLAARLRERGLEVAPRDRSTLVSFGVPEPEAAVERLAGQGFVVRQLPGRGLVRASVGAWSSEEELDRLSAVAV